MGLGMRELEMARRFYGYGRWDAPYWFIGPEQGKGPKETGDNTPRVNAWLQLGGADLCDCRDFHDLIGEKNWHKETPRLQSTWRPLMALLMTFLGEPANKGTLRDYQRDRWGRVSGGETCVIELSGLPARNSRVPMPREQFRQERIEIIRQRMITYKPRLVVMYGVSEKAHWEQIAGAALEPDRFLQRESSILGFTRHPAARRRENNDWEELGKKLRLAARI
jgi:hypothetical protein